MESALYGIYALVFVSEILLVRCAHSFDFWYVNNSCVNTVRQHFPWSILYVLKEETKNSLSYLHVSVIESRRLMKGIASTHQAPAFELGGSFPLKERSSR